MISPPLPDSFGGLAWTVLVPVSQTGWMAQKVSTTASKMNLLVLSDLHLGPLTQHRTEQFLSFLEAALRNRDEVLIVGDLFDLWFGWENLTMQFQKSALKRMKEMHEQGLQIDYVEGNRDFGIRQMQGILFRTVAEREFERDWYGRKIHAEHGDLVNETDRPYRLWRKISKSSIAYSLMANMPPKITLRLALRLEQDMRKTNRKNKSHYPEQSAEKFLLNMIEAGIDLVIVGHFHVERVIQMQAGKRNVLFYNLPGWEQGFRYLVIPSDFGTPYFKEWGKQNGDFATA